MVNENVFQRHVIQRLKATFPGCYVMKTDPTYIQGFPDLLILHGSKWAALEVKRHCNARHRPNQNYYIDKMNDMSFASFIYPENEEEVFDALERSFS